jgi:hypothetical protein
MPASPALFAACDDRPTKQAATASTTYPELLVKLAERFMTMESGPRPNWTSLTSSLWASAPFSGGIGDDAGDKDVGGGSRRVPSSSAASSARRHQPFRIGFVYDQEVLLTFNARPASTRAQRF